MVPKTLQILIASLVTLFLGCGVYAGFWYIVSLREESFRTHAEERARAEAHVHEVTHMTSLLSETEEERKKLRSFIVEDEEVTTFLELIEKRGRALGLALETKTVTTEKGNASFETLVLSFEIEGSYEQVIQMLKLVETLPYQVGVRSVALDHPSSGAESGKWVGEFTIGVTKETAS